MASTSSNVEAEKDHIVLGLLESVERDGSQSQRHLALELGIALGLVNAYLKRCIKKGLVKVGEAPARRYAYYLTPQGFAEKSRLTVDYLSSSLSLFRRARADCSELMAEVVARGSSGVVLAGMSDLAEIAVICALERKIEIVAVVDPKVASTNFMGVSVVPSFEQVAAPIEAVIVTDLATPRETFDVAIERFGCERVWAPALLGLRVRAATGKQS
ncbi:MAG TPA: winged helix-turn-helix transcriptional regulator [Pseudolabrys sp.]|nr:winged helix-turn-helix transcriptional regulator [Pseudolabrys sp.]